VYNKNILTAIGRQKWHDRQYNGEINNCSCKFIVSRRKKKIINIVLMLLHSTFVIFYIHYNLSITITLIFIQNVLMYIYLRENIINDNNKKKKNFIWGAYVWLLKFIYL